MGLSGIDLFSPSDVVEKKNTRKVCMCIRSLSKKVRSKQLNVPDFDMVTYTVAMPTDNVGCLRRSLEQSQRSFSRDGSLNSEQVLMENLKKINSIAASKGKFRICSEESADDSYGNVMIEPDDGSSITCSYGASFQINSNLIDSRGVSSVVEKHAPTPPSPSENNEHQFEPLFLNESSGSCSFLLGEHDYQDDGFSSSPCMTSPAQTISHSDEIHALYFCDLEQQNDIFEGSLGSSTGERSDVTNQLSISDMIFKETGSGNPIQFDGNDSCYSECSSLSSHGSNSTPRINKNGIRSKLYDTNDVEEYSAAHIKPVSDVAFNLDFGDQLHAGYDIKVVSSPEFLDRSTHLMDNESQNIFQSKTLIHYPTSIANKPPIGMDVTDVGLSTKPFLPCSDAQSCATDNSDYDVSYDERTCGSVSKVEYDEGKRSPTESNGFKDIHCNQCLNLLFGQSSSLFEFYLWDQKGKCAVDTITSENYGNNENNSYGPYPHDVLEEDLQVQNASCNLAKPTADLLVQDFKPDVTNRDKVVRNAAIFELDHLHNHFKSELKSADEDCAFHDWDRMIQHNSDQNRQTLVKASENHPLELQNAVCPHPTTTEQILYKDLCSTIDCAESLGSQSSQVSVDYKSDTYCARNVCDMQSQNNEKHEESEILAVENSDTTDDPNPAKHKPNNRRLLLKSVVRGTVVFGALFLFLQLRKSIREETNESNKQLGKAKEENGVTISRQKQQKESKGSGIYPAYKLGFNG